MMKGKSFIYFLFDIKNISINSKNCENNKNYISKVNIFQNIIIYIINKNFKFSTRFITNFYRYNIFSHKKDYFC